MTGGAGVDFILDLVGAKHFEKNLQSLRPGGRLLVVGLVGGSKVELDLGLLLRRRLQLIGTAMRGRSLEEKIEITNRFQSRVLPLLREGRLKPVIDRVFPFEEVRAAHEHMEANRNIGKIVLRV
jgi:NADPH:quinone reductase-like Zn-dependent oxidoreductase